jgi:hypothetical protein
MDEGAALRRQLRPVADHAGCDAIDVRDFRATQPEGVRSASLLLLGSISVALARREHCGKRRGEQQREAKPPMRRENHRIPLRSALRKVWVNRRCFASVAHKFLPETQRSSLLRDFATTIVEEDASCLERDEAPAPSEPKETPTAVMDA